MTPGFVLAIEGHGHDTLVVVSGDIDEHADLAPLESLSGRVELDLAGVRRFNSIGARFWVEAMRALSQRAKVEVLDCSRAVVEQLKMVRGFLASATVRSFYAPMRCSSCLLEIDAVFDKQDCVDRNGLASAPCPSCGGDLELDESEEAYLLFIREPTLVG